MSRYRLYKSITHLKWTTNPINFTKVLNTNYSVLNMFIKLKLHYICGKTNIYNWMNLNQNNNKVFYDWTLSENYQIRNQNSASPVDYYFQSPFELYCHDDWIYSPNTISNISATSLFLTAPVALPITPSNSATANVKFISDHLMWLASAHNKL